MAKPAKPAAAKKEEVVADAPKSKKKLIIIGVVGLLVAGAAGWYFMKGNDASHVEEPKVEAPQTPTFIALDAFTVNLQREDEGDQYLQINLSLKVFELELVEKIKAVLPEIRSKLNLLLSSKRASELSTAEGKKALAAEIMAETNHVLGIHNAPAAHAPASAPAAAPAAVAEVVAAPAPTEGEAAPAEGEAEAPVIASAPAPAAPAVPEKKGVVDVLFTSFIIQ